MQVLALILITVFGFIHPNSQNDLPPLTVTEYVTDADYYYVVDVETGEATQVDRSGPGVPITGAFYGYSIVPKEIPFQSPYDESLKFVLVNDYDPQTAEVEADYNLYRINEAGNRTRVAEYAWTGEFQFWSPDGRYLYVSISDKGSAPLTLYRYELQGGELTLFAENAGRLTSCDGSNTWCVFSNTGVERDVYQLYTVNKNTGEIWKVDDLPNQRWTWVQWQTDTPEFFYVPTYPDIFSVYAYDTVQHSNELVVTLELPYRSVGELTRSPDGRWLAMFINGEDDELPTIALLDLNSKEQKLIPVTSEGDRAGAVSQFSLEWSKAGNTLLFTMKRDGEIGLYAVEPEGEPRKLLDIPEYAYIFDYAQSPDGNWLAVLIVGGQGDAEDRLVILPIEGGSSRDIPFPAALDEVNCIGWLDETTSMRGAAYLCDKEWGEG